jgi:pimeloyl-ACP methyl ester carboxylesterase
VIVPYLRGYGTTRFLSSATPRNGQPSVIAVDMIALMDALKIEKATIGGCDWGARTANIIAALWPQRCKAMVSVSGYLIGSQEAGKLPLPPKAELEWWYQFYFATERGRAGYEKYRHDFSKLIWQLASPKWAFDDATFDRSAAAFANPIMSPSSFTITAGGSVWLRASQIRRSGKAPCRISGRSRCPPSPSRGCQRRAASGAQRLRQEILRQV